MSKPPLTNEQYEAQKKRLLALIDKWWHNIGFHGWRGQYTFDRTGEILDEDGDPAISRNTTAARTTTLWAYLNYGITWNMPHIATLDDEACEELVIHELVHVLIEETMPQETTTEARAHNERVVSQVANALKWTWNKAREGTASSE